MRGELDAARCAPPTARRPPAVVDVLLAQPNERARSTNLAAPDAAAAWAAPMAVGAGGPPGAWQSTATPTPLATSTWTSPNGIPYGGGSRRRALRARQRALAPTRVFPRPRNSGNPLLVPPAWRLGPRCVSRASRASRVRDACVGGWVPWVSVAHAACASPAPRAACASRGPASVVLGSGRQRCILHCRYASARGRGGGGVRFILWAVGWGGCGSYCRGAAAAVCRGGGGEGRAATDRPKVRAVSWHWQVRIRRRRSRMPSTSEVRAATCSTLVCACALASVG